MESLKNYTCEICGGELEKIEGSLYQCPYCKAKFYKEVTLPEELKLDLHSAERARSLQRFEDALNEYDRIIKNYPKTFDAYWGACLADYGIQYEKDYDGLMIPTVHRYSEIPVPENRYYMGALKYCKNEDELNRIKTSAAEIEGIRSDIGRTIGTQEPYDIFLCYKEKRLDNPREYASEFYWADDLYRKLKGEGYRVFFAKESLPRARGDYEAHIFPALKSAKLMLILTSSVENVESVWVKNEWSRFIRFSKGTPEKRFKVISGGINPATLPRELNKEQALNHDSSAWVSQLDDIIEDIFGRKKKAAEEKRRREDEERQKEERIKELEKKLAEEEQRKKDEEERKKKEEEDKKQADKIKELEKMLEEMRTSGKATVRTVQPNFNVSTVQVDTASKGKAADIDYTAPRATLAVKNAGPKKLMAIKLVREFTGMGLKEAKDLVEGIGTTSEMAVETAENLAEELQKLGASIELVHIKAYSGVKRILVVRNKGKETLSAVKFIKSELSLGLKEAKDILDGLRTTGEIPIEVAAKLQGQLDSVGAVAEIVETNEEAEDILAEAKEEARLRELEERKREKQAEEAQKRAEEARIRREIEEKMQKERDAEEKARREAEAKKKEAEDRENAKLQKKLDMEISLKLRDATISADKKYITFGTYPQKKVTDITLLSRLNASAGKLPKGSLGFNWKSYKYYADGAVSDYMWYTDVKDGSSLYRGVYFTNYRPCMTNYKSTLFNINSKQKESGYVKGTVYWFKFEPLKWKVLTEQDGRFLLFSEKIVDSMEFYHPNGFRHDALGKYINESNYEYSDIRKWLNGYFLNTAFSETQRNGIELSKVDNSLKVASPNAKKEDTSSATNDKIFLLSHSDVVNTAYGFGTDTKKDEKKIVYATDYAKCQGVRHYMDRGSWRLRTPTEFGGAETVSFMGEINRVAFVKSTEDGICPALWLKL